MAIKYCYANNFYNTESEAQDAVVAMKLRLDNNPTDWMTVKEIVGSQEAGWQMNPNTLTDEQINNLDDTKTYMASSPITGENCMPLTASEVEAKVTEFRTAYADWRCAGHISKFDDETTEDAEKITPNEDMSGYVTVIPPIVPSELPLTYEVLG